MRALVRWLGALLAVIAVGLGAVVAAGPAGAQEPEPATTGAPETPSADPAIDDLVGCVQGSKRLLVMFLIDESASLKQSDPENQRVDAARAALDSLVALASTDATAAPDIQVALAAFSNEYRLVQDWTPAGADQEAALNEALDSFATLNSGIDTDFVNALTAGREALADQAAAVTASGGAAPCRAILLFTDGGYDLAVRPDAESQERLGTTKPYAPGIELTTKEAVLDAEAAGRKELCREGGLADRIRQDDITMLTVALSGTVARRSQLPLAAATTGIADDYTCGSETSRPSGAYIPAEGVDVLVTSFNEVGTRLAGGNLIPGEEVVAVCGGEPCDEGSRTFTLDKSLRRAQILSLPPEAGSSLQIQGPKGATATISTAGPTKVGDVEVTARELAGRGWVVDLQRPADPEAWEGEWKASILGARGEGDEAAKATLQIFVFSDIGLALTGQESLVRGETTTLQAELVVPEGVDAASVVRAATVEVRLANPVTGEIDTVELTGEPTGPYTGTYETPADTTVNLLEATGEARLTTAGGAALLAQASPTEILVQRPAGSIQLAPGSLKMPSLTGEATTEAEFVLFGGDTPGCVWFGQVEVPDAPEGAGEIQLLRDGQPLPAKADCIPVGAKERVTITIVADPLGRASGQVSGTLEVFEKTDEAAETTTQVPFRFDMARGVDEAQRLLLAAGLLLVGLGIPMVALLIINSVTARFQALDAVRGAAIPVLVNATGISRTDAGYPRPLVLKDADFTSLATTGNDRRFAFGGVVFRAQASRNPFAATIAMAAPEGGAEKLKGNAGSRVELDPALAGSWVFLLDADKTRRAGRGDAEGLLIAFVAEGDFNTQTNRMMPGIQDRLPATASRLAGLVRGTKRKPAKPAKAPKGAKKAAEPDATVEPEVEEPVAPLEADGAAESTAETTVEPLAVPEAETVAPDTVAPDTVAAEPKATDGDAPEGPPPAAPPGFTGRRPGDA